jgi:hypothetical protein
MRKARGFWLPLGFALGFLAVGVPYWLVPYSQVDLPNALVGPGLLVVAFAALVVRSSRTASSWRAIKVLGASVPAAVIARVIVDAVRDPTSHNLWPFEVVIAVIVGFLCAGAGTVLGTLVARLVPSDSD